MKEIKNKLVSELDDLVELGELVTQYYHVEKDPNLYLKYNYLFDMEEVEYGDEDRKLYEEYIKFEQTVSQVRKQGRKLGDISEAYERFYTPARRIVSIIAPERLSDFVSQYQPEKRAKLSSHNYTIFDGISGLRSYQLGPQHATSRIKTQVDILKSIQSNLGSALFQVEQEMKMELADDELKNAEHLLQHGHVRAAGALAGVVLESHLKGVAITHGFKTRKKAPGIADYNEYLKSDDVLDVVGWRKIQGLADIRNLCDHAKERAPTEDDVSDLIVGVKRIVKLVF